MEDSLNLVEKDKFAKYVGIKIIHAEPGYAVTQVELKEHHKNGLDMVQGGLTFTLADIAAAAAGNAGGTPTVAIGAAISYFRPPTGKILTAKAREVSASGRIRNYAVEVRDEHETLVSSVQVTGYRKG